MAVSLDDKLLGEKTHYYCSSSSEDEAEPENLAGGSEPPLNDLKEYATNTGPKGVINDFRRYKQLESERREEQEAERLEMLKKIQLTCRSELDDKKEKDKDEQFELNLEDLLEDEFLKEYRQKRIEEMRKRLENVPKFGKVIALTKENFLDNIDKEDPSVKIVVHIYEDDIPGCEAMNGCLQCLAKDYQSVKFCLIKASTAKLSTYFSSFGVPAILVYKNRELIGNFIRLTDEFGDDFYATDVEDFLISHGVLPDKEVEKAIIRCGGGHVNETDSDLDLD